jgi:hypothetical protein
MKLIQHPNVVRLHEVKTNLGIAYIGNIYIQAYS